MEMKLNEQIKQPGVYKPIAEAYGVTEVYVGLIAQGHRKATRGKGLLVKRELERIAMDLKNRKDILTPKKQQHDQTE
jgi:hypothetical protein